MLMCHHCSVRRLSDLMNSTDNQTLSNDTGIKLQEVLCAPPANQMWQMASGYIGAVLMLVMAVYGRYGIRCLYVISATCMLNPADRTQLPCFRPVDSSTVCGHQIKWQKWKYAFFHSVPCYLLIGNQYHLIFWDERTIRRKKAWSETGTNWNGKRSRNCRRTAVGRALGRWVFS